jgi:hypothetical protein
MQNFSQLDPNYSLLLLGKSTARIADYGCTTCCIADVARDFGVADITPGVAARTLQYTADGSIIWKSLINIGIKFEWRGYNYDAKKILAALGDRENKRVLLQVTTSGSTLRHWVVADEWDGASKFVCRDPYGGIISKFPNSAHPLILGYAIIARIPQAKPAQEVSEWGKDGMTFLREELEVTSGPQDIVTVEMLGTILKRFHAKFFNQIHNE